MRKVKWSAIFGLILIVLIILAGIFFINSQSAINNIIPHVNGEDVVLYSFYGQGCPHCAQLSSFLNKVESKYPSLQIIQKEVYFNQDNRILFQVMANAYGRQIEGVPTVFINDKIIVGYSSALGNQIEQEIIKCMQEKCPSPLNNVPEEVLSIIGESSPPEAPEKTQLKEQVTLGAVIAAAAVDAINPCAFAVLIILLTTILAAKQRKKALYAGLTFSAAIFISYLLMGIGLYSAIQLTGITHAFFIIVAVLAIILGLFNLKDYFWYGKLFVMEVPRAWRPKMKGLIRGVTSITGAFLIGFVVSLFLLPCTSGPYIVILALLAKIATKNYALMLLLLYNLIFILPMLIITGAVYYGFTTVEKAEEWKNKKLKILHLIAGAIMLLLGIGMIIALVFGYL